MARGCAPVIDIPTISPVFDKAGRAQDHEMLRDGALAETQHGLKVADTLLPFAEDAEDGDARRMTECAEQACLFLVDPDCPG
jgi:hypothetical protein